MKRLKSNLCLFLALVLLLGLLPVQPVWADEPGPNLVTNSSFETGSAMPPSGWSNTSGGSGANLRNQSGASNARDGSRYVDWWVTDTQSIDRGINQTINNVEPGYYSYYLWARGGDDPLKANVTITATGSTLEGGPYTASAIAQAYNTWVEIRVDDILVAETGSVNINIQVQASGAGTSWGLVDDVNFFKTGELGDPGCSCGNECTCGNDCSCAPGDCACPPPAGCSCGENCTCGSDCSCTPDNCACPPPAGCSCGENCTCGSDCTCTPDNCTCPPPVCDDCGKEPCECENVSPGGVYPPITVQKVEGLSPDFYMGADISSFDALWNAGVTYRNRDGRPMTHYNEFFALLADAGINYARIRVFNDPYYRHPTTENGCIGGTIDNNHRLACPTDHPPATLPAAGMGFSPFPGRGGTPVLSIEDDGKSYGGGNNDLDTAIRLGLGATSAGMKTLVNYHYSDFWADPGARRIPKAWRGMSQAQLVDAIYNFTYNSLKDMLEAGVDVGMVQVGNESNSGLAGQSNNANGYALYAHAMGAIDQLMWEYRTGVLPPTNLAVFKADGNLDNFHIKKAIHRDQPSASWHRDITSGLATFNTNNPRGLFGTTPGTALTGDNRVDYEIVMASWYSFWRTQSTFFNGLRDIINDTNTTARNASKYWPKEIVVSETSAPYIPKSGNGFETIFPGTNSTPQSQATDVRNAIAWTSALPSSPASGANLINVPPNKPMGTGLFYWELAWLPINQDLIPPEAYPSNTKAALTAAHWSGSNFTPNAVYARNMDQWNEFGVGWASKYSSYYARTVSGTNGSATSTSNYDEGHHWGGAPKDNMAVFDFWGYPIPSIDVFNMVYTGGGPPIQRDPITILPGAQPPATVMFSFVDGTSGSLAVQWDAADVAAMLAGGAGNHQVKGTVVWNGTSYVVVFNITVAAANLVTNPGFTTNTNGWTFSTSGGSGFQRSGSNGRTDPGTLEKRNNSNNEWIRQTISNVPAGYYEFSMWIMGSNASTVSLVVNGTTLNLEPGNSGTVYGPASLPHGWAVWVEHKANNILVEADGNVTIEMVISAGQWACIDDISFMQMHPNDVTKKANPPLAYTAPSAAIEFEAGKDVTDLVMTALSNAGTSTIPVGTGPIAYEVVSGTSIYSSNAVWLLGGTGETVIRATKPAGDLYTSSASVSVAFNVIGSVKNITIHPDDVIVLDKIYDGMTRAEVIINLTEKSGVAAGDVTAAGVFPKVITAYADAVFSDAQIGAGKTVQLTNIRLGGIKHQEYTLLSTSLTIPNAASITTRVPVQSRVHVQPVDNLRQDFQMGVDISSEPALRATGAITWYDENGQLSDPYAIFANAGATYVRAKVWNDPYYRGEPRRSGSGYLGTADRYTPNQSPFGDGFGAGAYGGGANDVKKAIDIGQRATAVGMKTLVNFHYSDTWGDPERQFAPKAWLAAFDPANPNYGSLNYNQRKPIAEVRQLLYDFTYNSLEEMILAGVDIGMVQIGNESNGGLADFYGANMYSLMRRGCEAVDAINAKYGTEILKAVHFVNPNAFAGNVTIARELDNAGVDYDVFLFSWYPNYHGSLAELLLILNHIANTYDKLVGVGEISYPQNSSGNGPGQNYPLTIQGQANILRDCIATIAAVDNNKGIGIFYWEPAWPSPPANVTIGGTSYNTSRYFATGWSNQYAGHYDSHSGNSNPGGSPRNDNQLFVNNGTRNTVNVNSTSYANASNARQASPAIDVWKLVYSGAIGETLNRVDSVPVTVVPMVAGATSLEMPATVMVIYLDGQRVQEPVVWNQTQVNAAIAGASGDYTVSGTATTTALGGGTQAVTARIEKRVQNLLQNPGFEIFQGTHFANWTITVNSGSNISANSHADVSGNARNGDGALHWGDATRNVTISQVIPNVSPGYYNLNMWVQGNAGNSGRTTTLAATGATIIGTSSRTATGRLGGTSWGTFTQWGVRGTGSGSSAANGCNILVAATGDITVSVNIVSTSSSSSWGALDDFYFAMMDANITRQASPPAISGLTAPAQPLEIGDTFQLNAESFIPGGAGNIPVASGAVTYAVTAGDAITVDPATGLVTAVKGGTATVTATKPGGDLFANDATASIEITVNEEIPDIFIVTFDPDNDVTAPWDVDVTDGETVAKPADDPVKAGYDFLGWFLGDDEFDFDTPVTEDITLKAKWALTAITLIRIAAEEGVQAMPMMVMERNKTHQFHLILNPEGALATGVVWTVNNAALATVDSNGFVTIKGMSGNVTLTARAPSGVSHSIIIRIA